MHTDTNDGSGEGTDCSEGHLFLRKRMRSTASDLELLAVRMSLYFGSMVDPETNRFFLLSYPDGQNRYPHQSQLQSGSSAATTFYSHQHCPLRDLGSAWDAVSAVRILLSHRGNADPAHQKPPSEVAAVIARLNDAVLQTIQHYSSSLASVSVAGALSDGQGASLSPEVLNEPPNIAHNGLLLLALVESERLGLLGGETREEPSSFLSAAAAAAMDGLANGILAMQRSDGAFRTHYPLSPDTNASEHNDDEVLLGIEFFSGEAMTALVEALSQTNGKKDGLTVCSETRNRILSAMVLALAFYRAFYEEGKRNHTIDANYAIWQVQAFGRLSLVLRNLAAGDGGGDTLSMPGSGEPTEPRTAAEIADEAADYCRDMCMDIVRSPAWRMLSRGKSFYPNLSTVEIACGLDALVQGGLVEARRCRRGEEGNGGDDDCLLLFSGCIDDAIDFLRWSQERVPDDSGVGHGGLGYGGLRVTEQRLDVTGHALSAVSRLVSFG